MFFMSLTLSFLYLIRHFQFSACCVCDNESSALAVTIYRLSQDYGLTIGDWLLIPEPVLYNIHVRADDEVISLFKCATQINWLISCNRSLHLEMSGWTHLIQYW